MGGRARAGRAGSLRERATPATPSCHPIICLRVLGDVPLFFGPVASSGSSHGEQMWGVSRQGEHPPPPRPGSASCGEGLGTAIPAGSQKWGASGRGQPVLARGWGFLAQPAGRV